MGQDRFTGAEANKFGRECGARIIGRLGGEIVKKGANECVIDGELLTLHCASKDTNSVGVTRLCLERVKGVLGAFEQDDGTFSVFKLQTIIIAIHAALATNGEPGSICWKGFARSSKHI